MKIDIERCFNCKYGSHKMLGPYVDIAWCNHPYRTGYVGLTGVESSRNCLYYEEPLHIWSSNITQGY